MRWNTYRCRVRKDNSNLKIIIDFSILLVIFEEKNHPILIKSKQYDGRRKIPEIPA